VKVPGGKPSFRVSAVRCEALGQPTSVICRSEHTAAAPARAADRDRAAEWRAEDRLHVAICTADRGDGGV
jgi:hypothetical protein